MSPTPVCTKLAKLWLTLLLVLGLLGTSNAAQVQHLGTQTATATGAGATGKPSMASFNIPSGKNRVLFIWASFERDHCSLADDTGGLCTNANTAGTGLGDNWPEPRTGTPPATTTANQITAQVVGPGGTINKKNALTIGGTPSGDLRFQNVTSSPNGSPSGTSYYSLSTFHIALFEGEINTLLGGAASGTVNIALPDVVAPNNAGDEAILIASVYQNVEQTAWGMVRNATALAQLTVAGPPTYTPGNFNLAITAYDASPGAPAPAQTPDEADDGKLLMPLSTTTEGFLTPAGHTSLASVSLVNSGGIYDTPNTGYATNEPSGISSAAFFRNGGATPGSLATVTSAAAAATQVYGGIMASFLLESDNADVGDAPISYGNPSHTLSGIRLGASVDADAALLNNATATGDDTNNTDDEDGVTLPSLAIGGTSSIPISIQNAGGFLSAWFDWNADGDFNDSGEQMVTNQAVAVGTVNVSIAVPATALAGPTFARFRVCTNNTATDNCSNPTNTVQSGEVEDYAVSLAPSGRTPLACASGLGGVYSTWTGTTSGTGSFTVAAPNRAMIPGYTWTVTGTVDSVTLLTSETFTGANQLEPIYGQADNASNINVRVGANSGGAGSPINISAITKVTFNSPTPANGLGFSMHDFETDQVRIRAKDANGVDVPIATIASWFVQVFDANQVTNGTNLPHWDPAQAALVGNLGSSSVWYTTAANVTGDHEAAGGWFQPDISLSELSFDFQSFNLSDTSSYHLYLASCIEPARDYGDAPATYDSGTAASHTIPTTPTVYLGSTLPDGEASARTPLDGTGDDATGTDDEDGVASFPTLTTASGQTYTVSANVTNSAGSNAYLVGYIDFNRDGDFLDAGEKSSTVTVSSSATNPRSFNVGFTTPAGMTAGTTYARFRLSSTQAQAESSVGAATSGEVEDYQLTIATPSLPPADSGARFCAVATTGDTNTTDYRIAWTYNVPIQTLFPDHQPWPNNQFDTNTISAAPAQVFGTGLTAGFDTAADTVIHLGQVNQVGAAAAFAGRDDIEYEFTTSSTLGLTRVVNGLAFGRRSFSGQYSITVLFSADNFATATTLLSNHVVPSGGANYTWTPIALNQPLYIAPSTTYKFRILFHDAAVPNTVYWDDFHFSIGECQDYGDAPTATYAAAAHGIPPMQSVYLGSVGADPEASTQANDNAQGSGPADEDGVSSFPLLTTLSGQTYTVSVNASNTSGSPAYLVGYIDFNRDGDFLDAGEKSTTVTVNASSSQNVSFTTPAGMTAGTTYARFRLSSTQAQAESSTGTATSGEVEDYSLTIGSSTYSIAGKVFEDKNYGGGAGRDFTASAGVGRPGVRVELYDSVGAYVGFTFSDASGNYSFTGLAGGNYTVRVVNAFVTSSRTGGCTPSADGITLPACTQIAVQTFRTNGLTSNVGTADTERVGGENPSLVDAAANTTSATLASLTTPTNTPQSITPVTLAANATGIDFGYNFDTIVSTRDSGQGSLRQFITNSNALSNTGLAQVGQTAGKEVSIFMIPDGNAHPGLRAGLATGINGTGGNAGAAVITLATALPLIFGADTSLDATTQTTNVGNTNPGTVGAGGTVGVDGLALSTIPRPEVAIVLNDTRIAVLAAASNILLKGFASYDGPITGSLPAISSAAPNGVFTQLLVGTLADGSDPGSPLRNGYVGLNVSNVSTVTNNYFGYNFYAMVFASGSGGSIFTNNEINHVGMDYGEGITATDADALSMAAPIAVVGNLFHNYDCAVRQPTAAGGSFLEVISSGNTIVNNTLTQGCRAGIRVLGSNQLIDRNIVNQMAAVSTFPGTGILVISGTGVQITRNSLYQNSQLGIDLRENGVTANNGTVNTTANTEMDYPIITSATLSGGTLEVGGFVGNNPAGSATFANLTLEFFIADNSPANQNGEVIAGDGRSAPHGEGRTYIGSCTTDGLGLFTPASCSFSNAGALGLTSATNITATATDASGNTSEFGAMLLHSLSGRVFEDINYGGGSGRNVTTAAGVGRPGVRVELYNSTGVYVGFTFSDASGNYSFTGLVGGNYTVRVVNSFVTSSRTGGCTPSADGVSMAACTQMAVQTFRTNGLTSNIGTPDTARVGGEIPNLIDAGANTTSATLASLTTATTTAQSITPVALAANASGVDFGFNFDTIVSTRDSGQGSLRQFILNSNALQNTGLSQVGQTAGKEVSIFMISDGLAHPGLRAGLLSQLTSGVAILSPTTQLPSLSDPHTTIDGRTQTNNVGDTNSAMLGAGGTVGTGADGRPGTGDEPTLSQVPAPEVEIRDGAALTTGLTLAANNLSITGISIHGFGSTANVVGHGDIYVAGVTDALITQNVIGARATSFTDPGGAERTGGSGVWLTTTARATINNNLIGFAAANGVACSDVINGLTSSAVVSITNNEFRGNALTFTGNNAIELFWQQATNPTITIQGNLLADTVNQGAIHLQNNISGSGATLSIDNNTITNTNSTLPYNQAVILNLIQDAVVSHNIIERTNHGTLGIGLSIQTFVQGGVPVPALRNRITQNAIYDTQRGPGIDLWSTGQSGLSPRITPNDGLKDNTKANASMDYPVITYATLTEGSLEVRGFVGNNPAGSATFAGAVLEFFIADNTPADQNAEVIQGDGKSIPHGEGWLYLGSCTADGLGIFNCTFPSAGALGLTSASNITATATDASGNTSEFGAVQTIDYGDAPTTYDSGTPASHITALTPTLYLGSVAPDSESSPPTAPATDDNTSSDDEDAFITLPPVPAVGTYTLSNIPLRNTSGPAALHAWIDFNRNGSFEASEYTTASVALNATTAGLTWNVPAGASTGATHARFRLTTQALSDNVGTPGVDERSLGLVSDGEVEDYPATIVAVDYGDAPDTGVGTGTGNYQTLAADGGPNHIRTDGLRLGTAIDGDPGTLQNASANADDADGTPDDEDGVASFPLLTTSAGQTYAVSVAVRNFGGSDAYVVGYIDFNQDGDFSDPNERSATVTVVAASGDTTQTLSFTTPAGMTVGTTYARFRLATVQAEAETSVGAASGGEVEDYQISISSAGFTVSGSVYADLQPNTTREPSEDWSSGSAVYVNLVQAGSVVQSVLVNPGSGSYSFSAVIAGNYSIVITNSATSITSTAPSGWLLINPSGSLSLSVNSDLSNQDFGLFHGSRVSGRVFYDDGLSAGTANDALQNGGELGLPNAVVTLTDGSNTLTTSTNTLGNYSFYVPHTYGGSVAVSHDLLPASGTNVSNASVNLASTYADPTAGERSLSFSSGQLFDGYNFGIVRPSTFKPDQSGQVSSPGTITYSHLYQPGTLGIVSFAENGGDFAYEIRLDANCNGSFDVGETWQISPSLVVDASWPREANGSFKTCAVEVRVSVAGGVPANSVDIAQIAAALSWANNATVTDPRYLTDTTTVLVGGVLQLSKEVRNITQGGSFAATSQAKPGDILEYRIHYQNLGTQPLFEVELLDPVPWYSDLEQNIFPGSTEVQLYCPNGNLVNLETGPLANISLNLATHCTLSTPPHPNGSGNAEALLAGGGGYFLYRVRVR